MRCKKSTCPWYISGSHGGKKDVLQVIAYVNDHQCNLINKTKKLNFKRLVELIIEKYDSVWRNIIEGLIYNPYFAL